MRDLFDEFMDELRKRQGGGEPTPREPGRAGREPAGGEGDDTDHPDGDDSDGDGPAGDHAEGDEGPAGDDDSPAGDDDSPADDDEDSARRQPTPLTGSGRGRGGGGRRPRPRPGRAGGPNDGGALGDRLAGAGRRIFLIIVGVVILLFLLLAGSGLDLWTDAIWFRSVGYDAVFFTRLWAQLGLFAIGAVIGVVVLFGNLWLAGRLSPPPDPEGRSSIAAFLERISQAGGPGNDRGPFGGTVDPRARDRSRSTFGRGDERPMGVFRGRGAGGAGGGYGTGLEIEEIPDLTPAGRWLLIGLAGLLALGLAGALSGQWETILLWMHRTTYGTDPANPVTDPIFHRDIGFFLFELPFLRLIQSIVNGVLLAALFLTIGRYVLGAMRGTFDFSTPIRLHLAVLGGLYLLSVSAGYQLDKFELVYSTQGVASGVAFTDANARFFAFDALTVIAALSGALLVGGAFTRLIWPLGLAIGAWLLATVLLAGLYPQFVQRFSVEPNQFAQERTYVANNIAMTRLAYGVDHWEQRDYSGAAPLTQAAVDSEEATFQNARLWDYAPLGATLDQIQTVRQYYDFTDVDTDRYPIDGTPRQVMLSARELDQTKSDASSWVNQRLTYTHGIGVAMVPVNEVTPEGLPDLLIRDLPPVSAPGVPTVTQPRIYFGERPSTYIIVDARQPEFDYPANTGPASSGDQGPQTSWTGKTGIALDSTLPRLLFAARFRDLNLLISDQVTPESQLLMHRSLLDRLQLIAPFLRYDNDPYVVVGDDGRLFYIQDAYTISDRFPNAQPFDNSELPNGSGLAADKFDYIRNSVKVVMDAYDGTITFYAADPLDPIVRAYAGVFPTLFKPLDQMPADLRAHLRVPEELFDIQTRMYARYHVTDPETFYRNSDLWTVPASAGSEQSLPTEPYYVVMRMPGEPDPEFLLLQPMVPKGRPNMISWVAARNDAPNYGTVRVYRFPQDTAVRGPNQIEAQISTEPSISSQITLWNTSGSKVVRGNLIVVPVQDSIVYLQPIYLQSTTSPFPAFQKIVVATSTKVVWGNTLAEALQQLLAGGPNPTPTPTPTPTPGGSPTPTGTPSPSGGAIPPPPSGDVAALVAYANEHFELAQAALRAGDFGRYGQEIAAVQAALAQLGALVPTPAPSASP